MTASPPDDIAAAADRARDMLKALGPVVEGTPSVQTYDVATSTFHKAGVTA